MKNSFDDRCLTLGVRRDWLKNDTGWLLKACMPIPGNFSLTLSATAATQAPTVPLKKSPAFGFSPYIYHGLQYNFTDYFGVEGGIIIPAIFVMSIQWSFR